jgi:hypothetical protein
MGQLFFCKKMFTPVLPFGDGVGVFELGWRGPN